jgi:hypothetical protein
MQLIFIGIDMANFKRKKTKRNVKCTMCTQWRWMGNKAERMRISDRRKLQNVLKSDLDMSSW